MSCYAGQNRPENVSGKSTGFTLLELLIVMVIVGIALSMVSLNGVDAKRRQFRGEIQALARQLESVREEALLQNSPMLFDANVKRYRFLIQGDDGWKILPIDGRNAEHRFAEQLSSLSMASAQLRSSPGDLKVYFSKDAVESPFVLTFKRGDMQMQLHADGIGKFWSSD